MAERIVNDPHLEVMPDHAGAHYKALRITLVRNGIPQERAIQALNDSWTLNHNERIQRWDQQVIDDNITAQEAQGQQQQEERKPVAPKPQEGSKKPRMMDFDDAAVVGNYIAPTPSPYALRRLEDFEYVDLWYFTPEAKNTLIRLMNEYQWTKKSVNAFAQFYTQLELHHFRWREHGERALILYQARVRREWHDQMKIGNGFNIGLINEDLLRNIYREILDEAQLLLLNELRAAQATLTGHEGTRTPTRRYFHDKDFRSNRIQSNSGRSRNPSRSRSPSFCRTPNSSSSLPFSPTTLLIYQQTHTTPTGVSPPSYRSSSRRLMKLTWQNF